MNFLTTLWDGWPRAFAHWGWLIALVAVGAVAIFATYTRPAAPVVDPVVQALAPSERYCPSDWRDNVARDEHIRTLYCRKGDWLVILWPDSGAFNFCYRDPGAGPSEFILDPRRCPGWPQ
jgi:hypothetical protein